MENGKNLPSPLPLYVSSILAIAGVIVFGIFMKWDALSLNVQLSQLAGLLAPLAFAAAVVERGVEILVSPWRDAEASKLDKAVTAIKARPVSDEAGVNEKNAKELQAATDKLDEYRGETQRYAFAASLTLSLLAAMAGVRALGPFADPDKLKLISAGQHQFFLWVDVILSAALLAGGADGVHSVMSATTSFFDASSDKSAHS